MPLKLQYERYGLPSEVIAFNNWLGTLPHRYKVKPKVLEANAVTWSLQLSFSCFCCYCCCCWWYIAYQTTGGGLWQPRALLGLHHLGGGCRVHGPGGRPKAIPSAGNSQMQMRSFWKKQVPLSLDLRICTEEKNIFFGQAVLFEGFFNSDAQSSYQLHLLRRWDRRGKSIWLKSPKKIK